MKESVHAGKVVISLNTIMPPCLTFFDEAVVQ